jgi:hypothetical protein
MERNSNEDNNLRRGRNLSWSTLTDMALIKQVWEDMVRIWVSTYKTMESSNY